MKVKVYNLEGKETGEINLSDKVFNVPVKQDTVHQVFVALRNIARQPWADTKGKGEVSGGGKKPWPQKGTGRARHGSIRSPIWKGGGVAFGPLSTRNYKGKINKKIRRLALKMCLSDKVANNGFMVVEDFNFIEPKTKLFANFLKLLPAKDDRVLILTAGKNENVLQMTRNLPKAKTMQAEDLNVVEILSKPVVIINKEGVAKLEEILGK
ncbi:MAG: 50S ribosomal protein L4 [Patescibacteria group bacterium]|nr:50S ribosomal protein L4 [Patescibacteria group bacterium]